MRVCCLNNNIYLLYGRYGYGGMLFLIWILTVALDSPVPSAAPWNCRRVAPNPKESNTLTFCVIWYNVKNNGWVG
jgi:hypothetical protein